jgi:hypothetical protein
MVSREEALRIARAQQAREPEEPLPTTRPSRRSTRGDSEHAIETDQTNSKPWWKR